MDYDLVRAALYIVGAVLFYAVLTRGMFNMTEPYRVAALEIAERLCASDQVSDRKKSFLYNRLGEVYSNLHAWKLAILMLGAFAVLPFQDSEKTAARVDMGIPSNFRGDYDRFKIYWMVSTVGNSPAAAFVFVTLALIMVAFFASVSAISGCLASPHDHHGGDHRPA